MTRDEAIHILYGIRANYLNHDDWQIRDRYKSLCMAINALDQEPKTGHWIQTCKADENGNATYRCSECGHTDEQGETKIIPFCWFCGCRMVKPQESEDKE